MIFARIRDDLDRVRKAPFFPLVPLVPIALVLTNVVMLALVLRKVSKIAQRELT